MSVPSCGCFWHPEKAGIREESPLGLQGKVLSPRSCSSSADRTGTLMLSSASHLEKLILKVPQSLLGALKLMGTGMVVVMVMMKMMIDGWMDG